MAMALLHDLSIGPDVHSAAFHLEVQNDKASCKTACSKIGNSQMSRWYNTPTYHLEMNIAGT
jgi:hypothetical protein